MPITSFSGSAISSTYQRIVQTDGTYLADGTGSILNILNITASYALNAEGGSTNTGSLLTTASVNLNTITFTKGDGSTFPITVNTGSGGGGGSTFPYTGSAIITGSLIVTGSIVSTQGFTGSLLGTSSYSNQSLSSSYAITASNTVLQSIILTNQTVGGLISGTTLAIGTSLESILRTMLVTYIPPTLTSLVMRLGGSSISTAARDVGNSFTTNTASFSATADNPTSIFPLSSSFTASGADIGTQTFYFGNNVLSTTNTLGVGSTYTINRATVNGTVTFTVNGKRSDTGATITATTTSIQFQWRNYLAASSTIPVDNTTAQTVVNASVTSALDTDRGWTATCTAANDTVGNFTYVIYPASYGDLSNIIQNGALSVLSAFTKLGDFTITNAYAASISVRIYKSNSDKAFASGTTLAIS
jgi:hypothetical protein